MEKEFQVCDTRVIRGTVHFLVVEGRHCESLRLQFGLLALSAVLLPVGVIRAVAADTAERLLNHSPAQIRRHLMESDVEIILGDVVLCPVN